MSVASILIEQDQFGCPVCFSLLKDPVTIPCGHSFCKVCINGCWDQEDQSGVYTCPQCEDTFALRPVLRRNNILDKVVEKMKKKKNKAEQRDPGPGDVECDFCTETKRPAVRSCLTCLASFCQTHVKPHYELPALQKHSLVDASGGLQQKICSQHDKVLESFCRTDKSFLCYLCTMHEHKGHDTVTAATERNDKQSELKELQMKSQQRIQQKQEKVKEVKQAVKNFKISAQTAVEESEKIFTEMISSMKKKRSEVREMIRDQEKAELTRAERLLEKLEQEISELQRKVIEMEQLSHTPDHIHFLQSFLSVSFECEDRPEHAVNQHPSFHEVKKSVSDLKKNLEEFSEKELAQIPKHVAAVQMFLPSEPKSRDDFLQYFFDLTLDPNTLHYHLVLSEKNRVATYSKAKQMFSDHPDRFDYYSQVMSKQSVCGRCYWEVEWNSERSVFISVSYKDIRRKGWGDECLFGYNDQSWSLQCSPSSPVVFWHNHVKTELSVASPSKIGVYVDHGAGNLAFYAVSDTITLLHTVHTTFTRPLYAGFWLSSCGSTVRLKENDLFSH